MGLNPPQYEAGQKGERFWQNKVFTEKYWCLKFYPAVDGRGLVAESQTRFFARKYVSARMELKTAKLLLTVTHAWTLIALFIFQRWILLRHNAENVEKEPDQAQGTSTHSMLVSCLWSESVAPCLSTARLLFAGIIYSRHHSSPCSVLSPVWHQNFARRPLFPVGSYVVRQDFCNTKSMEFFSKLCLVQSKTTNQNFCGKAQDNIISWYHPELRPNFGVLLTYGSRKETQEILSQQKKNMREDFFDISVQMWNSQRPTVWRTNLLRILILKLARQQSSHLLIQEGENKAGETETSDRPASSINLSCGPAETSAESNISASFSVSPPTTAAPVKLDAPHSDTLTTYIITRSKWKDPLNASDHQVAGCSLTHKRGDSLRIKPCAALQLRCPRARLTGKTIRRHCQLKEHTKMKICGKKKEQIFRFN